MSSLPLLLNLIDELDRETYNPSYFGNDFGLGLHPHQFYHPRARNEPVINNMVGYTLPLSLMSRLSDRQLRRRDERKEGGALATSTIGKDGFQICMDVAQFKPSELSVKVVDNAVVVEGKHEEREDDHGFISRHFVRRYSLPKHYDADKVASTLSSDGILTVSVPKPQIEQKSNERLIQIQQVGAAHLNVKQNAKEKGDGEAAAKNGAGQGNGDPEQHVQHKIGG